MIWFKLIGFYENYSWGTYQLQNYAICWRYEWDRKKKTMWSVKFHDFQKHNITWDTMQWRCREDLISSRTAWFARTRIVQKKHTLSLNMMISITWYVIWTVPTVIILNMKSDFLKSLWIFHLQRNWREEVFGNKFYVYYEILLLQDPVSFPDMSECSSIRYRDISLIHKIRRWINRRNESLYCHRVSLDEIVRILIFNDIWTDLYLRNLLSYKKYIQIVSNDYVYWRKKGIRA